ncbi:ABC transporter B family member 29, chloroplastic-like [Phalaenopsis equestris]|uniref:ABC transporter B family member 29, chloroplastic-like n=1 Tax=Phalaenopsis equestris TaxID=78828 RepID=UPI0009E1DFA9|nr:ABC transporter B family member 29, chloroplastic-like [Phalaenopsis equestris]
MAQLFFATPRVNSLHFLPSSSKSLPLLFSVKPSHFSSSSPNLYHLVSFRFSPQAPRFSSSSFDQIKPHLQSEWEPILKGWICSAVSVCCLSVAVPKAGKIPSILTEGGSDRMGVPILLLLIGYLGERLQGISRKAQITSAKLSSYLNEVIPLMLVVRANNGELKENLHFYRLAHDDLIARIGKKKMKAFIPQIVQILCIGGLIVLHAISMIASKGSMDGSRLLSFTMSLALLIDPIQGMGKAFNELKEGEPAVERLFDLAQFHNKVVEKPNALDLCDVTGDIKFSGVTFRYGDNMPLILNEMDLHIEPGESVAFIGPSGGGKTTIVKLLLRLYDPLYGEIFLDDHNIQELKLRNIREHMVLVPQDTMLFSGTVAENIGYKDGSNRLDNKCVENAARIANADEFIRELPHGYHTNIGPRGSLLSGGQRQRIAIARALYRKSSILILDEATSALDSRSELLVRQALERLMENHTVLIIAHRIETMMTADRVLLVEGGKVEEVPKSSLLSPDGHLASILNSSADTGANF